VLSLAGDCSPGLALAAGGAFAMLPFHMMLSDSATYQAHWRVSEREAMHIVIRVLREDRSGLGSVCEAGL
jgi:hypothetical protein